MASHMFNRSARALCVPQNLFNKLVPAQRLRTCVVASQSFHRSSPYGVHTNVKFQSWNQLFARIGATATVTAILSTTALCDYQPSHAANSSSDGKQSLNINIVDDQLFNASLPPPSTITEKQSGVVFPTRLPLSTQTLIGASVRLMRQLVQVYSVGLYVDNDNDALKNQLLAWKHFNSADLLDNAEGVWDLLCNPETPKTIRMVVVRSVSGKHMGDGFRRALKTRVAQYASSHGGVSPSQVKKKMDDFCSSFSKVGLMKEGSVADISISTDAGGETVVKLIVDGRCIAVVQDKALAWALSDMYLGDKSVVSGMRGEVASGLEDLLRAK